MQHVRNLLNRHPAQVSNPADPLPVSVDGKGVITPLPEDPIKALRGALNGKPSMTKALLEDRKKEIEREEKITSRLLRRSWIQDEPGAQVIEDLF